MLWLKFHSSARLLQEGHKNFRLHVTTAIELIQVKQTIYTYTELFSTVFGTKVEKSRKPRGLGEGAAQTTQVQPRFFETLFQNKLKNKKVEIYK